VAKRLSARGVKSKQNAVMRYVVSTDIDKTSRDLGVSTKTLKRYLSAKPETIKKNPDQYGKLLSSDPKSVAKQKDVKLVQRLSGKRLSSAYGRYYGNKRLTRSVRLAQITREKHLVVQAGKKRYVPVDGHKAKYARKQVLANMADTTSASIMEQYKQGDLSEREAKSLLTTLWKNSDMKVQAAMDYFDEESDE